MEVEYHNLYDYFTSKYPRDFECEALDDVPEFKRLLNKLFELFKGMKISDDDAGESDNNEINDPRKISDPWRQYGGAATPYQCSILCVGMTEFEGIKGFENSDDGIFKFGFSKITPEIFINDIQKILENNPELKSVGAIFRKYVEIKTPSCVINFIDSRNNNYKIFNKRINDLHAKTEELKRELSTEQFTAKNGGVKAEAGKINKVSEWLKTNGDNINFIIGKELYDIINS